jgi:hypothetical protein
MRYEATDEDLPENLGGTWVDPDPDHAARSLREARERALAILTAPPDPLEHIRAGRESHAHERAGALKAAYNQFGPLPTFDL